MNDHAHGAVCFVDTETTSLGWCRRAWEIAVIARRPGQPEAEFHWFIDAADLDLGNADPASLKIGRYWERHPQYSGTGRAERERDVLRQVGEITRGAHLVGAVPSFDAHVLTARMRAHKVEPGWHYHLQDVETLAAGYLRGLGRELPALPWRSDDLTRAAGVAPPGDGLRHTALGDARWAALVWDAVMAPAATG